MKKKLVSWVLSSAMALNFAATMPINAFAASGDSRVYEKDGYTVTYSVGSEWDNNQTIEVTIQNTGEESILNWALKYDIDGALSNVWNSKVFCSSEEYTVIKNTGYNYEIEPGQAVKYGYILTSDTDAPAELPEDIELFNRRIDVKSGYETDFNITSDWYTGFQAEISITNTSDEPIEAWTLSFNGNFNINNIWNAKLISSENRNYVTANQLWTTPINPGESTSFGFTADKSATENAVAENFALTAVVIGESSLENAPEEDEPEDIDYELDTDEDGLPDYYEEILGTDKNNADTDSDGLNDGYEVFYLGTNPTKADSDDNGIPDGSEDPDNDGLTNIKECELGTDPNNADTDGDGLSDGAEVYTYGTDPLKYDTDDDGISDGDEITLGLDPNNGCTNGTPDSEKTFTQIVSSDSEVLSAINADEETPFKVSLEMKAAGVAENNIYVRESGYSNAIENSAIIGVAPEFVYTDGLAVEEVTVKFELENSIVNNTLGTYTAASGEFEGIKRLNVFMYIEDVNMLLPVETFHDEATNTVYTTTDRMGTYCLVDIELWLNLLGIKPTNDIIENIDENYDSSVDTIELMAYNVNSDTTDSISTGNKDSFDVVFMVDQVNYSNEQLEVIQDKILETSNAIWDITPSATIVIYGYNGDGRSHFEKYGRAGSENPEALNAMMNKLVHFNGINTVIISKAIDDLITENNITGNKIYCFNFFDSLYDYTELVPNNGNNALDDIKSGKHDINISIVSNVPKENKKENEKNECYATALYNKTGGIEIDAINFVEKALKHIYGENSNQFGAYNAIIATGYHTIVLKAPITESYRNAANDVKANPQNIELYRKSGMVDTDDDGLLDFQEINFEIKAGDNYLIQFDANGKMKDLPLALLCKLLHDNSGKELTYVENGWKSFEDSIYYKDLSEIIILPILSDPTNIYSDFDAYSDYDEVNEYKSNPLKDSYIISSEVYETLVINASDINYAYIYEKYPGSWMEFLENAQLFLYMNSELTNTLYKKALANYIVEFQQAQKEKYEIDYLIELGKDISTSINSNLGLLLENAYQENDLYTISKLDSLKKANHEINARIHKLEVQKNIGNISINKKATINSEIEKLKEIVNEINKESTMLTKKLPIDVKFKNIASKTIERLGFAIDLYEIAYNSWYLINEYAAIRANYMAANDCIYALRVLSNTTYDYHSLKKAAAELETILIDKYNSDFQIINDIIGEAKFLLREEVLYSLCSKLYGSEVFMFQFGVGTVDNIYDFSDNTKALVNNQANAGMTRSMLTLHFKESSLYGDNTTYQKCLYKSGNYYISEKNTDWIKSTFENVVISHIIGEKQFIEGLNMGLSNKLFAKEDIPKCEQFVEYLQTILTNGGVI